MDAVLRNFKGIPCPQGDRCVQPGCQWHHSWDDNPTATKTRPDLLPDHDAPRDEPQEGSRKRQRVSVSPPPVKRIKITATNPEMKATPASSQQQQQQQQPLQTVAPSGSSALSMTPLGKGSVSITSLGKKVSVPSTATTSGETPIPSQDAQASRVTSPKVMAAKAAPRKAESLNPRHLKTVAPATHDYRYRVLKALHEQFVRLNNEVKKDPKANKLVMSEQELIWLALDEEEKMATGNSSIYKNMITGRVLCVKRMTVDKWTAERTAEREKEKQKQEEAKRVVVTTGNAGVSAAAAAAAAVPAAKAPTRSPPKVIETGLTPAQEVQVLRRLRTPITKLAQYGYVPVPPSGEEVAKAREVEAMSKGWEVCDRCNTRFQVFPGRREEDGALTSGGTCTYHHGKIYYPVRSAGDRGPGTRRYRCCNEAVGDSAGCVTAATHVFKTTDPKRLAAVLPFAETPAKARANPVPRGYAVCFDCEMGYTVHGLELIRLTATRWPDGAALLDVLVRPVGEILDLNSRYSGVWPEDIVGAKPWSDAALKVVPPVDKVGGEDGEIEEDSPEAAAASSHEEKKDRNGQSVRQTADAPATGKATTEKKALQIVPSPATARDLLFALLAPDTPLIGHGLENDLNATRIVHPTLIDTVLLFPHSRGLPIRHGLRFLAESRLNRIIQAGDAGRGHDSAEDARAAGDLVRLKVAEEWTALRRLGWRFVGDELLPPGRVTVDAGEGEGEGEGDGGGGGGALTEEFLEGGKGGG